MLSSIKSQSRYKRSFYVSFSSSFSSARLIHDSTQCVTRRQPNGQPARRYHAPKHVFFVSKMFLTPKSITNSPCLVLYTILQCQSATRKRNTLLWLTGTENISFAAVMSTDHLGLCLLHWNSQTKTTNIPHTDALQTNTLRLTHRTSMINAEHLLLFLTRKYHRLLLV
jgi:hypothetical protein